MDFLLYILRKEVIISNDVFIEDIFVINSGLALYGGNYDTVKNT